MKKTIGLVLFVVIILISACVPGVGKVGLNELIKKAEKSAIEVNSYSQNSELIMTMTQDKHSFDTNIQTTTEIVLDPEQMKQAVTMNMPQMGLKEPVNFETYLMEDRYFYMNNPLMSGFVKYKVEKEDVNEQQILIKNPVEQINFIEKNVNNFHLNEKEQLYILSLKEGKENDEDIKSMMDEFLIGILNEAGGEAPVVTYSNVKYTLEYDKKTLLPKKVQVSFEATLVQLGEEVKINLHANSIVKKYDHIDKIILPEEAINAEEI